MRVDSLIRIFSFPLSNQLKDPCPVATDAFDEFGSHLLCRWQVFRLGRLRDEPVQLPLEVRIKPLIDGILADRTELRPQDRAQRVRKVRCIS